jgi:hypothetical protein
MIISKVKIKAEVVVQVVAVIRRMMSLYSKSDVKISTDDVSLSLFFFILIK